MNYGGAGVAHLAVEELGQDEVISQIETLRNFKSQDDVISQIET